MRTSMTVLALTLSVVALPATAQTASPTEAGASEVVAAAEASNPQTIAIDVNGLVCDFCAQALNKVFAKREEVEAVDVDLKAKIITLTMKPGGALDDATLSKLIVDAGYNVVAIRREGA